MLMRFERFIKESPFLFIMYKQFKVHADIFSASAGVGRIEFIGAFSHDFQSRYFNPCSFIADHFVAPAAWIFKFKLLSRFVDNHHFFLLIWFLAVSVR